MNIVELVERASLGSLLLEADQVGPVSEWLRESDFLYPRSQVTYRLITSPTATGSRPDIHAVLAAALADPAARLNAVAGPYLHELLASPGRRGRAAVYGRLVVEASVRRRLDELAARLRRLAQPVARSGQGVPALAEATGQATCEVDGWLTRIGALDQAHPAQARRVTKAPPTPAGGGPPCRVEGYLVDALTDNPGLVTAVGRWLRPRDFHNRQCAGTYRSILALAAGGQPVDHITVTSNRRDRYALTPATPGHLVAVRPAATSHDTVSAACQVLAASLGRVIVAAAAATTRLVDNPTMGTGDCLDAARQHLTRCVAELDRWPSQRTQTRAADPPSAGGLRAQR